MIIVIPIEVKDRELYYKVFLAYQILKYVKKAKVIICSNRFMFERIGRYENCIFFEKNTYEKRLNNEIKTNNKILMLDEEGPISLLEKHYIDYRYKKKTFEHYDKLLFWGSNDLKKITNFSKYKTKTLISGHPKFDLLKKPYIKIYDKKVSEIKKKYNSYILFASSFEDSRTFSVRQQIIGIKDSCKGKSKIYISNRIKELKKLIYNHQKNYDLSIKMLKEVAKDNPKINIIFRRHPYEDEEIVKKRFEGSPKNLFLDYSGSITPWIIGSEVYIHSGCTTYFEASILKKNIISFIPHIYGSKHNFFKKSKTYYSNIDKIKNYIKKSLEKNKSHKFKIKTDDISKTILNYSRFDSYKMIINQIQKIQYNLNSSYYFTENEISFIKTLFLMIKKKIFNFLSFIKNNFIINTFLINLLKEKYIISMHQKEKKIDHLTKKDINLIISKLKIVDNNNNNKKITINKICKNVFICNN